MIPCVRYDGAQRAYARHNINIVLLPYVVRLHAADEDDCVAHAQVCYASGCNGENVDARSQLVFELMQALWWTVICSI